MEFNCYTCKHLFLYFYEHCVDLFISLLVHFIYLCFKFVILFWHLSILPFILQFKMYFFVLLFLFIYLPVYLSILWFFSIHFSVNMSCLVLHTLGWSHYLPSHQLHCNCFSASLMSLVRVTGRWNKITKQMILCFVYCYQSNWLLPAIECVISTNFTVIFE